MDAEKTGKGEAAPAEKKPSTALRPNEDPDGEGKGKGKAKSHKPAPPPPLPPAPATAVDENGRPRFGEYAGSCDEISWEALREPGVRGRVYEFTHLKRWQYASAATNEVAFAMAIFESGAVANVFAYVFDRRTGQLLCDLSALAVPGLEVSVGNRPAHGLTAHFQRKLGRGKATASITRTAGSSLYSAKISWSGLEVDLSFDTRGAAPPLTMICPIEDGGTVDATLKSGPLVVRGVIAYGETRFVLDGSKEGRGAMDYTSGLLARRTDWRWASAYGKLPAGPTAGLNLTSGHTEAKVGTGQNAIWYDGRLYPVGKAKFEFNPKAPHENWHITTSDGALDLEFRPEGVRSKNIDLKVMKSAYEQPIGAFFGKFVLEIDGKKREIAVDGLAGVTEDHLAVW